jgi:hypothetical protein
LQLLLPISWNSYENFSLNYCFSSPLSLCLQSVLKGRWREPNRSSQNPLWHKKKKGMIRNCHTLILFLWHTSKSVLSIAKQLPWELAPFITNTHTFWDIKKWTSRTEGVAQVVYPQSKHKALSSNPNPTKPKQSHRTKTSNKNIYCLSLWAHSIERSTHPAPRDFLDFSLSLSNPPLLWAERELKGLASLREHGGHSVGQLVMINSTWGFLVVSINRRKRKVKIHRRSRQKE